MTIAMRRMGGLLLILAATAAAALSAPVAADAATVARDGHILRINEDTAGSASETNNIRVTAEPGLQGHLMLVVEERGGGTLQPLNGCASDNDVPTLPHRRVRCAAAGTLEIEAHLGELDDQIFLNSATLNQTTIGKSTVNGGAGDDTLTGLIGEDAPGTDNDNAGADTLNGNEDSDTLHGLGGNDILDGGQGSDDIRGGDGNDTLVGGTGGDEFHGGADNDTVDYESQGTASGQGVHAATNGAPSSGTGCENGGASCEGDSIDSDVENLKGTAHRDILIGSSVDNTLTGRGGNDDLHGLAGADTLNGDAGNDRLQGGAHDDTLNGGDGNDTADYRDHVESVTVDLAATGAVQGGSSDGSAGSRDTISGVENADGGTGDDFLYGTDTAGGDRLDGGAGDDLLRGEGGPDTLVGGNGNDTASYNDTTGTQRANGVTVTIGTGTGDDGNADDGSAGARDTVDITVENLIGTAHNDSLQGSVAANRLEGLAGDDTLRGLAGADVFIGGAGTGDLVTYDTTVEPARTASLTLSIDGVANDGDASDLNADDIDLTVENLRAGDGNDTLIGSSADAATMRSGNNRLDGRGGDDLLIGWSGSDTFIGGTGEDVVDYSGDGHPAVTVTVDDTADDGTAGEGDNVGGDVEGVIGTAGVDVIAGGANNNKFASLGGNDTLNGFAGADILDGGDGTDQLAGGTGDDLLHGGSGGTGPDGADTIEGGAGIDTVTYATALGGGYFAAAGSGERTGGVNVSLDNVANDGAPGENDSVTLVENIQGGAGNDILIGTVVPGVSQANVLDGRAGDDTLNPGNEGNTPLSDTLIGGPGDHDRADYSTRSANDHLVITLDGVKNDGETGENDHLHGDVENVSTGAGDDRVTDSAVRNSISTSDGADSVFVRDGSADTVDCGGGTDQAQADRLDSLQNCETVDLPAVISVADVTVDEGAQATFTVTMDSTSPQTVTVDYTTADDTAKAGQDYTTTSGTLTFSPNDTSETVTVPITQDSLDEDAETFTLKLTNAVNAEIGDDEATATITDDEATPTVSVGRASIDEGDEGTKTLNVPVTLSGASSKDVTVRYSTGGGSANLGEDYEPVAEGTVTIPAGQATANAPVVIRGDALDEPDETFTVTLSSPTNADLGTASATQTIVDDDGQPSLSVDDAQVTEGDEGTQNLTFTVRLSAPAGQPVTVGYATSDGSASHQAGDYMATTGELTFAPGETTKTVHVPVIGDTKPEPDETITLTLSNPGNATISDGTATGTIDDDDTSRVSVGNASATEGDSGTTPATFTITLDKASERPVTVGYSTASGTATAGEDYTAASGMLTFAPGETTKTVDVPVRGDTLDEANETFTLELSGAEGGDIAAGTGTGTITDDDAAPTLSVAGGEVTEGNDGTTGLTFTVTQSDVSSFDVTVKYATADGTAKAGEDYTATSGTLTIKAGDTSGRVTVPVTGDTGVEEDETFSLVISEPQNATIADGKDKATGLVKNDDQVAPPAVPAIAIDDVKTAEGDTGTTPAVFTVTLSAPTTATVTVKYVTRDGTATSGSDYAGTAGSLTFAPGERTQTFSVNVIGDRRDEADETFALTLSEPQGATLGKASGGALIIDDESPRVAPRSVTARTTPSRDASLPYRFRTYGRVSLPSGVRQADACAGKVQVRFKAGSKTISTRRANLREDCTFTRRVSFGIKSRLRPGRLKVQVRFLGNAVLLPKSAPRRFVRVVK